MIKLAVIRLKDGTQEFIRDEDDLINLVEQKLGKDISSEIKSIIDDLRFELQSENEFEQDDETWELECKLDEIQNSIDELIAEFSSQPNLQLKLIKIRNLTLYI